MEDYIDFIIDLRMQELNEVSFELYTDITPRLKEYFRILDKIDYKDGYIHCFYGEVKYAIKSFINFWVETMDAVIALEDKHRNTANKSSILKILDNTIKRADDKCKDFTKEFKTLCGDARAVIYEELKNKYNDYSITLIQLKEKVEKFDKAEYSAQFAQEHMIKTVKKTHKLLECTHTHVSLKVASFEYQIRMSLEEICNHTKMSKRILQESIEASTNQLRLELYSKNKEHLTISRKNYCRISTEEAEIKKGIEMIQNKLESSPYVGSVKIIEEELQYWLKRMEEFLKISHNLRKIKEELSKVKKEIDIYNKLRTTEYPGSKACCWATMGENYLEHQKSLKSTYCETARTLFTFFFVRGEDKSIYTDNVGKFTRDEFFHKIYYINNKVYHKTCDGDLKECEGKEKCFRDVNGKYYIDGNGEKIYRSMDCRSCYRLGEDDTLIKITKECGHSNAMVKDCQIGFFDMRQQVALPESKEINIKDTLDPEVVSYLWNNVASILTMSLRDVAKEQPKNPIHFFAHRLLANKYRNTIDDLKNHQKESDDYRNDIYRKRKEKAQAEAMLWKSKQVKRRLPEESDDRQEQMEAYYHTMTSYVSLDTE